jgi:uncharacterized protein YecT (DUF1311 family)
MKRLLLLLLGMGAAGFATAGVLEECMPVGNHAAVTRCIETEDSSADAALARAEAAAADRAREIERATGRPGPHAALARSVRAFAQYRDAQCNFVKEMYASGSAAAQARLACRADLTRRRVRELSL